MQTRVSDLRANILICSVDVNTGNPLIFRTAGSSTNATLRDVGLATSAAPTYFPEHQIGKTTAVDGGLIANAPDMLAIFEALQAEQLGNLRVLSIGTAGREGAKAYRKQRGPGLLFAAKPTFDRTLDAQEKLSIQSARQLLGDRCVRLDTEASQDEREAIGLDRTGSTGSKRLRLMADRTWSTESKAHEIFLRDVLNRTR